MDIHPKRMYGSELLAQVKTSGKLSRAALAMRCGYAKVVPQNGRIIPDYEAFWVSIIEAKREQDQAAASAQQIINDRNAVTDYERRIRTAYAKSKNQGA